MQTAPRAPLTGAPPVQEAPIRPRRRIGVLVLVALVVLVTDLSSKLVVVARLEGEPPIELLGGLLTLRVIRNAGAAFGLAEGFTLLFTCVAVGVAVAILRTARRLHSLPWAVALGLLLGGAVGNLTDRLFRDPGPLRGHVVDFLELPHWPVFNLADSAIVCGGVLAVLLAALGRHLDGTHGEPAEGEPTGHESAGEESAGGESAGGEPAAGRG
ncbi:MAG: signal peptidase II [Actinomycetes bacterium]